MTVITAKQRLFVKENEEPVVVEQRWKGGECSAQLSEKHWI